MKMRMLLILTFATLCFSDVGGSPYEATVKPSPTSPWIEVYHDGLLTSEWQPSDGTIYEFLDMLLNDTLAPVWMPHRLPTRLATLL